MIYLHARLMVVLFCWFHDLKSLSMLIRLVVEVTSLSVIYKLFKFTTTTTRRFFAVVQKVCGCPNQKPSLASAAGGENFPPRCL